MPPKFQSSFIPKASVMPQTSSVRHIDLISLIAKLILGASVLAAVGVLGYQFYLKYSIQQMGQEVEALRQSLSPQLVQELLDLNNRMVSAQTLVENHKVLSPLFVFLEQSTPQSVRFVEFDYRQSENGPLVILRGEAKSFAALALESANIHKNADLKDPAFSDIRLDSKGNVTFTVRALVSPSLTSYQKFVNKNPATPTAIIYTTPQVATTTAATSTATSTRSSSSSTSTGTTTKKSP